VLKGIILGDWSAQHACPDTNPDGCCIQHHGEHVGRDVVNELCWPKLGKEHQKRYKNLTQGSEKSKGP
jgi:hypothetical protein